jgi:uncharacterized protein YndB with AHSA1/START domain
MDAVAPSRSIRGRIAVTTRASTKTTCVIGAPPDRVYRAFIDPDDLLRWLPPGEMSGVFHEFDARVGGGYRMSLVYPPHEQVSRGKTTDMEDVVNVRFVELSPPRRIVEAVDFVSDDEAFAGTMSITVTLSAVPGGTEVTMAFANLPPGLRPEDNEAGAAQSLDQLARYLETPS